MEAKNTVRLVFECLSVELLPSSREDFDSAAISIDVNPIKLFDDEKGREKLGNMALGYNSKGQPSFVFDYFPPAAIRPGKMYQLVLEELD